MIAVALVACSSAGAEPGAPPVAGGHRPAGWKQLPLVARAVASAAASDGVIIDAVDAWGEPALGCYGVWLDLHGGTATAAVLADQVIDSLSRRDGSAGPRGALAVDDLVRPSGADGVLAFQFAAPPYRGRVRAQLSSGRISAIACFRNHRTPAVCDAACADVLGRVPGAAR